MTHRHFLISLILTLHLTVSFGQNGAFQTMEKITIETPYIKQTEFIKWYYDSTFYEAARQTKTFECLKLNYKSDTANVEAWLYKPIIAKEKLPIIIYNRGGMGNYGNLTETNLVDFYKMAEHGYVVIATKTRFTGVNGKNDQHGGIDVDDIINLRTIYENLPYVDTSNVFMYGYSRGGQNTYQASLKMKLNAMVVTASVTDWLRRIEERSEFVAGWSDEDTTQNYLGFAKVFPNWQADSIQILIDRSAVYWAYQISTPVLILHSRQDTRVPCMHSIKLAEQLQLFGKEYSLIIYEEASHSLPFSQFDSYDQMFLWFDKHKKKK